jgi:oligoribonuclease
MTGLDAEADVILEIAAEVTDFDFNILESYAALIKQDRAVVEQRLQLNPWWQKFPTSRDGLLQKLDEGQPLQAVEQQLMQLVTKHFPNELAILAGNSIHIDRQFIKQYWPEFDAKLHYRMLDVSAFKILMQGKYGVVAQKPEVHRAYDDIHASIAELQQYLDWFNGHRGS